MFQLADAQERVREYAALETELDDVVMNAAKADNEDDVWVCNYLSHLMLVLDTDSVRLWCQRPWYSTKAIEAKHRYSKKGMNCSINAINTDN